MEEFEVPIKLLAENVPESFFVGLIGADGLPISVYAKENLEKAEASAELASVFTVIKKGINALEMGKVSEAFVLTDKFGIILSPVLEDYFLVIGMYMPANLGKARLEIRKILPKIEEMMR